MKVEKRLQLGPSEILELLGIPKNARVEIRSGYSDQRDGTSHPGSVTVSWSEEFQRPKATTYRSRDLEEIIGLK